VFDPLTGALISGGLSLGTGILESVMGGGARAQEYKNQVAFQKANSTFARWQANFSKKVTDANNQYAYWQQTVQHNQDLAYVNSLRNVEITKSIEQAKRVMQARTSAGADYINTQEAISQQLAETQMQDSLAHQQYQMQVVKGRASVLAGGQMGATIDRLMQDFDRQQGDWETIQGINEGFRNRQYSRQQAGAITQYLNNYNSQQFYAEQPYLEPMAPFQPLPTLLAPAAPSMVGAAPNSGAAVGLGIGTSILGAGLAGLNTYQSLNSWTTGGKGAGTARTGLS
jgi:hypothetical protein